MRTLHEAECAPLPTSARRVVIDVGNSRVKVALFLGKSLIEQHNISHQEADEKLIGYVEQCGAQRGILSAVGRIPDSVKSLSEQISLHRLSHESRFPFPIDYDTPETLGLDRLAAVAGAIEEFGHVPFLIIDTGSAITYEYFNGEFYLGGAISPGISMRFKALHHFTHRLPLLNSDQVAKDLGFIGKSTRECMEIGVLQGVYAEAQMHIEMMRAHLGNAKVILTGGDAPRLHKCLNFTTFARLNLVLSGLNRLLDENW